jgi:hypothetical protein
MFVYIYLYNTLKLMCERKLSYQPLIYSLGCIVLPWKALYSDPKQLLPSQFLPHVMHTIAKTTYILHMNYIMTHVKIK